MEMQTLCTFPRIIICAKVVDNAKFGRYNQFVIEKLQKRAIPLADFCRERNGVQGPARRSL